MTSVYDSERLAAAYAFDRPPSNGSHGRLVGSRLTCASCRSSRMACACSTTRTSK